MYISDIIFWRDKFREMQLKGAKTMKIKCMIKDVTTKEGKKFKTLSVNKAYIENPKKEIADSENNYFDVRIARKCGNLEDRIASNSKYLDIETKDSDVFLSKKTKYPTIIVLSVDAAKAY